MISINPYEIILQMINFGILYYLLKRFLAKPLSSMLKNRANTIQHNLENAEMSKRKASELLTEQKEALKAAQIDAQSIRKNAESAASKELSAVIETGKAKADQLIDQAKKDIALAETNARKTLLTDVAALTCKVVEKFVVSDLSDDEKKKSMDALVQQVSEKPS